MNFEALRDVAQAVLYEGHRLYPYRASSLKNQRRFPFGCVYPQGFCKPDTADTATMRTEVLVRGDASATLAVRVRFLHLGEEPAEAIEREVVVPPHRLEGAEARYDFAFVRPDGGARVLRGLVRVTVVRLEAMLARVCIELTNLSDFEAARWEDRDAVQRAAALPSTMVSTQTALGVAGGSFVSMMDPPAPFAGAAAQCRNVGTWPVLAGPPGTHALMLSSAIILEDYPRIAPESPGNLFDGSEIDEILTLRILTLTESEKAEARQESERSRVLLDRTEGLDAAALLRLHGAEREPVRVGDRVRIAPRRNADIHDSFLEGKTARVVRLETDLEGQTFACVVLDDDPGRDLGELGFPGHRFFFGLEEVERL